MKFGLMDYVFILMNLILNDFLWNSQMFHLLSYLYKDLGKQLLIGSFLFQTSLIVCETKPFIIKIHGNPYIDDCEALDLKKIKIIF